jgi:sugar lactone lactonase YvrE
MLSKRMILTGGLTLAAVVGASSSAAAAPGGGGPFRFSPLAQSAPCTNAGTGETTTPLVLPDGFQQTVVAQEGDGGTRDLWDMNTLNETGPHAGQYLYRTHEVAPNAGVSVTDLASGTTRILAERADWERFDGIVWSPWQTILAAEETTSASYPDPQVPQAKAGLVYEIDPETGDAVALPAVGSRSHEGLRFDRQGNLYGISETNPGYIYKFVPDTRGDLSSGQLYALKLVSGTKLDGSYEWLPLDRSAVQVNSDAVAGAAGATAFNRPEDVETSASTGNGRQGEVLYVAVTGEDSVYAVDLSGSRFSTYVRAGGNAPGDSIQDAAGSSADQDNLNDPDDFNSPDNLALDKQGNLYVTEDPGGNYPAKSVGDDIWLATPGQGDSLVAADVVRFASLTDCNAEPTGIYFDTSGNQPLYVDIQHRSGNGGRDQVIAVTQP